MKKQFFLPLSFLLFFLSGSAQTTEWNFTSDLEGWTLLANSSGGASGGYLTYTTTGTNPGIQYVYSTGVYINSSSYKYALIKFKNGTAVGTGRFLWFNNNTLLGQKDFTIIANAGQYTECLVDLSTVTAWTGSATVNKLMFGLPFYSPVTGETVSIDYIKFLTAPPPSLPGR